MVAAFVAPRRRRAVLSLVDVVRRYHCGAISTAFAPLCRRALRLNLFTRSVLNPCKRLLAL